MATDVFDATVLDRLFKTIESRRGADPSSSYTAKLLNKGRHKIARKVGEEAIEVIVAAIDETPEHVAAESADVLYHLLVLWADVGVRPRDVWAALAAREGMSGIAEKAARNNKNNQQAGK
ncbi:phosphoribosyl-ATP diphosphatase [Defluviicoccus vanus]|uniref:Phosphoribosyl-ATP pyrophosphatase n=1 Tax=Defluviicoccus vanus TaxID=111831 RepID=A0A7H1N0Z0_9PROT|nr:phosphoribosyl-ATP diphosphatase [Defluviicoccus vanus]QNT69376.1 phosphoribosyl-ATP diphosphatase [Defluviicoccus vanus]